jgi:hypothetical protein
MSDTPETDASKALRFDLDQAGIERRERKAMELVERGPQVQRIQEMLDALCVDAERYRWLRRSADLDGPHVYGHDDDCIIDGDDLDTAIDSAIEHERAASVRERRNEQKHD